jgi:outer membrane PBP1 activator LpoA protein
MLIKSLKAWRRDGESGPVRTWFACLFAGLLLSGCSTVCLEPEELCASGNANTSLHPRASAVAAPEVPAAAPAPAPALDPVDPVRTAPVYLPGQDGGAAQLTNPATTNPAASPAAGTARIALLLPLSSPSLGGAAEAVRAGFLAAAERDGAGIQVDVVPTSDNPDEALATYARAGAAHDIIVGPLSRPAVGALIASGKVDKPTVALNHPEVRGTLPPRMLVAGLSIEDEARQAAEWAAREHPHGRVLILTGSPAWAQRAAGAFEARWSELGHTGQRFALPSSDGRIDPALLQDLKARLEVDPPELLFAAVDVAELRQVRTFVGATLPVYGGASINPGRTPGLGATALDGIHVVDLPWLVLPDHPAVMVYPRQADPETPLYMQRLYALGIDAFLVARQLAAQQAAAPAAATRIDGVTGRLNFGANAGLTRREAAAVYRDGNFTPVEPGP